LKGTLIPLYLVSTYSPLVHFSHSPPILVKEVDEWLVRRYSEEIGHRAALPYLTWDRLFEEYRHIFPEPHYFQTPKQLRLRKHSLNIKMKKERQKSKSQTLLQ